MSTASLLIELGCEELPAHAIGPMAEALGTQLQQALDSDGLVATDATVEVFATPRRIATVISAVGDAQPDQTQTRTGPAVAAAFDAAGEPTPAALGFARSCQVDVSALERATDKQGERLAFTFVQAGQTLTERLQARLPTVFDQLPMPKRMRWADGDESFLRPVQWLCVLHGDQALAVEALGLQSSALSRGHRFHAPEAFAVSHADAYAETLRSQGELEPDFGRRCDSIREQVTGLAAELGGTPVLPDALVAECAALVEKPVALAGRFDEAFLSVPKEVLIQTMQDDQRYFALLDDSGNLMPAFITISNIASLNPDTVREGNERVIRPRLADAKFFWDHDVQQPLASHLPALKSVVFQKQLGTLHDKTERLVRLSRHISAELDADQVLTERAARLAKCDLMTQTVYEFPAMQGIAGKYLIHGEGESIAVAEAIEQQYFPKQAGDDTASGIVAQVLSIADKADTLTGIFALGQKPTGTKDPFGLRRAALGLLRTLIERDLDLDLRELYAAAADSLRKQLDDTDKALDALPYTWERLRAYYGDQGIDASVVDAVMARGVTRPVDFNRRVHAVTAFLAMPESDALAAANKRCRNLLKKADTDAGAIDTALLGDDDERALHEVIVSTRADVDGHLARADYPAALSSLAALRAPVDAFFENVMVNVDDPAVKANRLALLRALSELCSEVADVSELSR
ncbi:MAG: glycine--tRNA ligase subunit beta [Pseudomonadota bacterium]